MTQNVEKQVLGHVLADSLARAREWRTGSQARYLKKALEIQIKELFAKKMQRWARAVITRVRAERHSQQQLR